MTRTTFTSPRVQSIPLVLTLFLLSIFPHTTLSQPATEDRIFPFPYEVRHLPNGLTVILCRYDSPGIVSCFTAVRAGSRDEIEAGHTGFAHLFEHMMFRGTQLYPAERYNEILMELGVDNNAFTSEDWTCYTNTLSADNLEKIIRIEADRFINLSYTEEKFRKESGAVLGEYNKDASNPDQILYETLMKEAFAAHTYRHTVIGFLEDIEAMPGYYDYSLEFYKRHYRPENTAVIAVGDLDIERTYEWIARDYADWKPGHDETPTPPEPPQTEGKEARIPWESPTLPYLQIGWHSPAFSTADPAGPALEVLGQLLFSTTAPLYQKLVLDEQRVETIYASADPHRDPYLFVVQARVKREEDLAPVQEEIEKALEEIGRQPVSAQRLDDARSHLRNRFLMGLETPGMIAYTLGYFYILSGDPTDLDRYYRLFEGLTPEKISEVVQKYLKDKNRTVVTLVQQGEL